MKNGEKRVCKKNQLRKIKNDIGRDSVKKLAAEKGTKLSEN
jgi:hypothetical protein